MSNTRLGKILKTKFESVSSVIKPRVGLIFNFDWDGPSLVAIEKISSDSVTLNRLSTAKPVDENTNYLPKDELEDVNTGKAVKASDVKVGRVYSCDWDGQSIVAVKSIDGDDVEVVRLRKVKSDEDTLVVDKDEVLEELGFIKGDVIEFKFGNRSKFESRQPKTTVKQAEDFAKQVVESIEKWTDPAMILVGPKSGAQNHIFTTIKCGEVEISIDHQPDPKDPVLVFVDVPSSKKDELVDWKLTFKEVSDELNVPVTVDVAGKVTKYESTQTNKYESKLTSNIIDKLIDLDGLSWMEISTRSKLDKSTISDLIDTDDYKELEKYSGSHLQLSRSDTVRIYFDPIKNSKNIKKVVDLFLSMTKDLVQDGNNHTLYLAPRRAWDITNGYLSIHRPFE